MKTENLDKLTLNFLSEEEYKEAQATGLIDENQMYLTPEDSENFILVDNYYEEERVTSKRWIDGKPIYRRVLNITNPTQGEFVEDSTTLSTIENIDTITLCDGYLCTIGYTYKASYYEDDTHEFLLVPQVPKLNYRIGSAMALGSESKIMLILEYTKTTDTGVESSLEQISENIAERYVVLDPYMLDERRTSKVWIDGRPIYRKVINFGELPNINIKNVSHKIEGLGTVVKIHGIFSDGTHQIVMPSGGDYESYIRITNTTVGVATPKDLTAFSGNLIMEYTKTSDDATDTELLKSPIETITNYTNKEQIVGTWVDGKTLYRRIYNKSHAGSTTFILEDIDFEFDTVYINGNSYFINGKFSIKYGHVSETSTDYSRAYIDKDTKTIYLDLGSTYYNLALESCIIIEYTKADS